MTLEQIKAYFDRFDCEALTSSPQNELDIQDFTCELRGNTLANYLKDRAWKDDSYGETRIYVIREHESKQIVLFFSLKCGILFTTHNLDDDYRGLSSAEKTFVNDLISARRDNDADGYYDLIESGKKVFDKDKLGLLQEIAEHRITTKKQLIDTNENRNIMRVNECYSAIEMKHFCRNDSYIKDDNITYPLGFGLFWQKIVPLVLDIAKSTGCEYLYLFAADRSDNPDDKKLVSYYKEALCFNELCDEGVVALRPEYDDDCVGMVQYINGLPIMQTYAWEAFSDHVAQNTTI